MKEKFEKFKDYVGDSGYVNIPRVALVYIERNKTLSKEQKETIIQFSVNADILLQFLKVKKND